MPDIQTEMQKILQAWEQPETTEQPKDTPMFTKTSGVSEKTFNIVRDQPGNSKAEYIRQLELKGVKKASSSSLLSQMIKQGHIWVDSSGLLHPNQKEYRPLKAASVFAKKSKKVKTSKVITSEPVVAPKRELIDVPVRTNIKSVLDDISLSDAHELYRKLHTYFGGLPK